MTRSTENLHCARKLLNSIQMTNKGGAKQHGGHEINERRRKSALHSRNNKAKARTRREELRAQGLNC